MNTLLRSLVALAALASLAATEFGRLSFTMATQVKNNETVTVEVAYPLGADGKPTAEAKDIAYYAPYWCEERFASEHGVFESLAEHFTVVGIFLDDRKLPADAIDSIDPASGSLNAIMAAVEEARKRLGLPPGKVFGCGHSSGASLMYWAARAKPDYFQAIAPISGRAPPITAAIELPTLHVSTFGDRRIAGSLDWHHLQSAAGWSCMLTTDPRWEARGKPDWLHGNTSESIVLTVAWLRAVADLRAAHGGRLPPPREWPAQVDAARVAATGESGASGIRAFPSRDLVGRFTAAHRLVESSADPATGLLVTRVTPLAGADRMVIVLVDPQRKADQALYDAVLVAGKGADAIAVQSTRGGPSGDAIAKLVAAEQERRPGRSCMVIAEAAVARALDSLPTGIARVVVDPKAPVAPGTTAVIAVADADAPAGAITVAGPFASPEIRRSRLLAAASMAMVQR